MRQISLVSFLLTTLSAACVDPEAIVLRGTVDVIVVDGTLTNLPEAQIIRLNRSKADPVTGRFGTLPITKATVEVIEDSSRVISCHETVDGSYQLPDDFKGQVGHAYQLRFTVPAGTQYASNQQVLQAVPLINKVRAQFNPKSIFPPIAYNGGTGGHDLFIDAQDPVETRNYYRWDWRLWEKQDWCRTCYQGEYSIYTVTAELNQQPYPPGNFYLYRSGNTTLLEDCFFELIPPSPSVIQSLVEYRYDYNCRTQCWEILYNTAINIFDDALSNGGAIVNRKVAQIPFYSRNPALVEIRQTSLTPDAYLYFKLFQTQTQNTGGLADTPPTALAGNVRNLANQREVVVGYFTVSAVAPVRHWLDRKDTEGVPPGLFEALSGRAPIPEPSFPESPQFQIINSPPRPPTAVCAPSDNRTPFKPVGWRQ